MKRSEKPSSHNWRFIFSEKECLIVLININRPNQVSVLQCSTDVVRDYTSRSSEHGGGTPGAHHPPAWYVSCQLNFRRFVWLPVKILATCHSDRISSNDSRRRLFLFSHKKGAIIQGRRLFQILLTGSQINELFKCSKFGSLINFPSLIGWGAGRIKGRDGGERGWGGRLFERGVACEQALLFGQAKRASRAPASGGAFAARSRVFARLASLAQNGRACSQAKRGDSFKYFPQKGAIIWGRRLIERRLLFEEIQ